MSDWTSNAKPPLPLPCEHNERGLCPQCVLDFAKASALAADVHLKGVTDSAVDVMRKLQWERDEARGKVAWMLEAFWLAMADMPHSDECAIETCQHPVVECPHVTVDCTCPECNCVCSCWRAAADNVLKVDEALKLCERQRDADDLMEEAMHMLLNVDAHMASERVPVAEKLAKAIGHRWPPYEVCEACDEEHATKRDVEGVPLCEVCYDECVAETRALNRAEKET